jgi:hypothetical protein
LIKFGAVNARFCCGEDIFWCVKSIAPELSVNVPDCPKMFRGRSEPGTESKVNELFKMFLERSREKQTKIREKRTKNYFFLSTLKKRTKTRFSLPYFSKTDKKLKICEKLTKNGENIFSGNNKQ